nr:MAG: hypothetical protein E4H34_06225 [Hyphomicrobiales bacterium]
MWGKIWQVWWPRIRLCSVVDRFGVEREAHMRIFGALLLAAMLPLGGCAGVATSDTGTSGLETGSEPPPASAELPLNYIVFFDFGSAELDETARGVIAQAIAAATQHRPVMIAIAGFSGERPNARTSAQMANQRYAVVTNALAAGGIDSTLFTRVELMDEPNLDATAVRRIEIHLQLP